jgi:hypothetical protein
MSFDEKEHSLNAGEPVNLYLITFGANPAVDFFAYTDAENPIVDDGKTYLPIAIDRDPIRDSGSLDKTEIVVRLQRDVELATMFTPFPATQDIALRIKHGHIGDVFEFNWAGTITGIGREGDECVISARPVTSSLDGPFLGRTYTIGCGHVLYDARTCRANKSAATTTGTIIALTRGTVTLASGWNTPKPADRFITGRIEWTNSIGGKETRRILGVTGDTLRISRATNDIAVGGVINVILGCRRNVDDCEFLHNNILNHGGNPWIPTENPVGRRNVFY